MSSMGTIEILQYGLTVSARAPRRIPARVELRMPIPKSLRGQDEGEQRGEVGYVPAAIVVRR